MYASCGFQRGDGVSTPRVNPEVLTLSTTNCAMSTYLDSEGKRASPVYFSFKPQPQLTIEMVVTSEEH